MMAVSTEAGLRPLVRTALGSGVTTPESWTTEPESDSACAVRGALETSKTSANTNETTTAAPYNAYFLSSVTVNRYPSTAIRFLKPI